jgi:uncharacterized membrane protein YphA (DoxX/SURF4 family)
MMYDTSPGGGKAWNVVLWVFQVVGALAFTQTGVSKLVGTQEMVQAFDAVGVGQWLRYLTGGLEILGAVLLVIPGNAAFGAWLLILLTGAATITHLMPLGTSPAMPAMLLALMIIIAIGRHKKKPHVAAHPTH